MNAGDVPVAATAAVDDEDSTGGDGVAELNAIRLVLDTEGT